MAQNKKLKKPRGIVRLLEGKCIACGARCETVCPVDAIEMVLESDKDNIAADERGMKKKEGQQ